MQMRTVGGARAIGRATAFLAAAALGGCGTYAKEDPSVADAAALPVTCHTREDCAGKWARAREWVGSHTSRPITADKTSITTSGPPASGRSPVYQVTIVQISGTEAKISFSVDCRGRCNPPEEAQLGDFNLFLSVSDPASR